MARNAALYLKSVGAGAMITAPMMSAAFMLREPLVDIILGPSWATLADVLAWLAPVGFYSRYRVRPVLYLWRAGKPRH